MRPNLTDIQKAGVPFGSRALGVPNEKSDYDYAMTHENYKKLFGYLELKCYSVEDYFKVQPQDDCFLVAKYQTENGKFIDILVLSEKDLKTVKDAMRACHRIPQYMMEIKDFRVTAFEEALIYYGWKYRYDCDNPRKLNPEIFKLPEIELDLDEIPFFIKGTK